jgi:hypothetical protein
MGKYCKLCLAAVGSAEMKMVFFSHPQTGGGGTANRFHAKLASGDGDSVGQSSVSETGRWRVGTHGVLLRHSESRLASKLRWSGNI